MLSIIIPTYEQRGHGPRMLAKLLETITQQEFEEPFEIIISDNSMNNKVEQVCQHYAGLLSINYFVNRQHIGHCENFNFALDKATGSHIKLMCMDDVFMNKHALHLFWQALLRSNWVVSNSVHIDDFGKSKMRKQVAYDPNQWDKNVTGMPSVIAYKKCDLRFDVRLRTYCDLFLYRQLYELYGMPGFIRDFAIGQRFWKHSASRTLPAHHEEDRLLIHKILNRDYSQKPSPMPGVRVDKINTIP